jgi:hypothetical protein
MVAGFPQQATGQADANRNLQLQEARILQVPAECAAVKLAFVLIRELRCEAASLFHPQQKIIVFVPHEPKTQHAHWPEDYLV